MWWAYALCLPRDDWLFHRISTVRNKSALIEKIHYFLKIATQSFPPCRRQFIDVICVHRSMSCDPWKLIWYEAIRTKIEYAFSEEPVLLMLVVFPFYFDTDGKISLGLVRSTFLNLPLSLVSQNLRLQFRRSRKHEMKTARDPYTMSQRKRRGALSHKFQFQSSESRNNFDL